MTNSSNSKFHTYFAGSGAIGNLPLMMGLVATYVSASTFLGSPSLASKFGYSWAMLALMQISGLIFAVGVVGFYMKKRSYMAGSSNILEFLDKHNHSNHFISVVKICVVFGIMSFIVCAQLMWASSVIADMLNIQLNYITFILLGLVLSYFVKGGFKATVYTDVVQAVIMLLFLLVMFYLINDNLNFTTNKAFYTPGFSPNISLSNIKEYMSYSLLLFFGMICTPTIAQYCMSLKYNKFIGFYITAALFFSAIIFIISNYIGVAAIGNIDASNGDSVAFIMASLLLNKYLYWAFALALVSCIASTVDSSLLFMTNIVNYGLNINNRCSSSRSLWPVVIIANALAVLLIFSLMSDSKYSIIFMSLSAMSMLSVLLAPSILFSIIFNLSSSLANSYAGLIALVIYLILNYYKYNIYIFNEFTLSIIISFILYGILYKLDLIIKRCRLCV